jgi:hypothetical protein
MTRLKEAVWAGAALCCAVFVLDISSSPAPSPEQGATNQTSVKIAALDSQVQDDAGKAAVGGPPASDEIRSSHTETAAAAAALVTRQAFARFQNGREPRRQRQKRTVHRVSPRFANVPVATSQAAFPPTWNDSRWSWNQSWQGQSDGDFRSYDAPQSPRKSADQFSWSGRTFYQQRWDSPNSCIWC